MLAAKLAFAVTPAARRYGRRKSVVHASRLDRDSRTKTAADCSDFVGVYFVSASEESYVGTRVFDLIEAEDMTGFSVALAAAAHVKAKRYIAPI